MEQEELAPSHGGWKCDGAGGGMMSRGVLNIQGGYGRPRHMEGGGGIHETWEGGRAWRAAMGSFFLYVETSRGRKQEEEHIWQCT